jgi:hypothetical protein
VEGGQATIILLIWSRATLNQYRLLRFDRVSQRLNGCPLLVPRAPRTNSMIWRPRSWGIRLLEKSSAGPQQFPNAL